MTWIRRSHLRHVGWEEGCVECDAKRCRVAVQTPVDGGVGSSWWYLVVQRTSGKPSGGANVREAGR